jgi:hypothetical protein
VAIQIVTRRFFVPLFVMPRRSDMPAVIVFAIVALLMMKAPVGAETPGKWIKGAPFPEPSEELVGASAGGKFYVFGGLGPGWIPQGLVYEYDPASLPI